MLPTLEANAEPLPQSHSPSMSVFEENMKKIIDKTDTNRYGSKIVQTNNQIVSLNVMFGALYLFGI